MNIMFFLIPKSQVAYVLEDYSIRQTAEKLSFHHYSAIPVLSKEGKYISTVSEGDLLWFMKDRNLNFLQAEKVNIMEVPHKRNSMVLKHDAEMDDLLNLALEQNFVPVEDDQGIFIGIITRKSIIQYFVNRKSKEDHSV